MTQKHTDRTRWTRPAVKRIGGLRQVMGPGGPVAQGNSAGTGVVGS